MDVINYGMLFISSRKSCECDTMSIIVVSEQKKGISSILRIIHNVVSRKRIYEERVRIEKDYGKCDKVKEVDDAMRLYYEWGNIDIIKT